MGEWCSCHGYKLTFLAPPICSITSDGGGGSVRELASLGLVTMAKLGAAWRLVKGSVKVNKILNHALLNNAQTEIRSI